MLMSRMIMAIISITVKVNMRVIVGVCGYLLLILLYIYNFILFFNGRARVCMMRMKMMMMMMIMMLIVVRYKSVARRGRCVRSGQCRASVLVACLVVALRVGVGWRKTAKESLEQVFTLCFFYLKIEI